MSTTFKSYIVTLKSNKTGETISMKIQAMGLMEDKEQKNLKKILVGMYGEEYSLEDVKPIESIVSIRITDFCPN